MENNRENKNTYFPCSASLQEGTIADFVFSIFLYILRHTDFNSDLSIGTCIYFLKMQTVCPIFIYRPLVEYPVIPI